MVGEIVRYDGVKINRFTGKTVEKITIKAAEGKAGLHTNAVDVADAIEKGTLSPNDSVYGIDGIGDEIQKVLDKRVQSAQQQGDTELAKKLQNAKKILKSKNRGLQSKFKNPQNG